MTIRERFRSLGRDVRGGAEMVVMAYAIIAVVIMGSLTAMAITSGTTAANQRAMQTAEAGIRTSIGTILAELNAGGADTSSIIADLPGRTFSPDKNRAVESTVKVLGVRHDGRSVYVDVEVDMKGRMDWTRKGSASLSLAYATSLADVVDGKAIWDYAAPSELNEYDERVVALWTAGEMVVYDPAASTKLLTAPARPAVAASLTDGIATLTSSSAGGCPAGSVIKLEARLKAGTGPWSTWGTTDTRVSRELATGGQLAMEARTSCIRGSEQSPFAIASGSIRRAATVPARPTTAVTVDGNGTVTAVAQPADVTPDGYEQILQVRVRVAGSPWSEWSQASEISVALAKGQVVEAQSRVRRLSTVDDSGWIESRISNTRFG